MKRTRRNLVGVMLGVGLLGAYFAFAQEPVLPRLRPVQPPDTSVDPIILPNSPKETPKVAHGEAKPWKGQPKSEANEPAPSSKNREAERPVTPDARPTNPPQSPPPIPEPPAPPPLPPIAPPVSPETVTPPPLPPALPIPEVAPPALPMIPAVPTSSPKVEPEREKSAPVTPWTPKDTDPVKTPPVVVEQPKKVVPAIPVSQQVDPVTIPEGPSRFVVPRPAAAPIETPQPSPQLAPPQIETAAGPDVPQVRRFDQVKVFRIAPAPPPAVPPSPPPAATTPPVPAPPPTPTPAPAPREAYSPVVPSADPGIAAATPQLTVEKRGPYYNKAGATLNYQIVLRNVGATTALQVRVEDEIPGMTRKSVTPTPVYAQGDRLAWVVPMMRAGEEKTFLLELLPIRAGDLVSTTSVVITQSTSFRTKQEDDGSGSAGPEWNPPPPAKAPAPASSALPLPPPASSATTSSAATSPAPPSNPDLPPLPKLTSTPPANNVQAPAPEPPPLRVEVKPASAATVGQKVVIEVSISNQGTATLSQMMLLGVLPAGLKHPMGDSIGADLPDLAPGETKTFKMPVTAIAPGTHAVEIRVKSGKDLEVVSRPQIEVTLPPAATPVGPALLQSSASSNVQVQLLSRDPQVALGKETVCALHLTNPGTIPATNVQVTLILSDGLEPTANAQTPVAFQIQGKRIVFAPIAKLPEGGTMHFHFGVRAAGAGEQGVRVQVSSEQERTPIVREMRTTVIAGR